MKKIFTCFFAMYTWFFITSVAVAQDNELTPKEKQEGWILLFDGKCNTGWKLGNGKEFPAKNIEEGSLMPFKAGAGWSHHDKKFGDFILSCDFKVSKGCNSGIFFRVGNPKSEVQTGIEIQVLDSAGKTKPGKHDSGAIYDILPPTKNTMKPAGEWNHIEIYCKDNIIRIKLNGEQINEMDLNKWTEAGKNPDGTKNKFKTAYKDMPRKGYIGFQDHGKPVWYKNIKVKPLEAGKANKTSRVAPQLERRAIPEILLAWQVKP